MRFDYLFPKRQRASESKFGRRDLSGRDHWQTLDIDEYRIQKPVVICLGGNGICDDPQDPETGKVRDVGTKKANAFCRLVESLVGLKIESSNVYSSYRDVDVLGFSYGKDSEDSTTGNFSISDVRKVVNNLLLPLFVSENGEPESVEESAKNFSLVTFFTHCHGSRELDRILSMLHGELLDMGYTSDDVHKIFAHSMQVSYCPLVEEQWVPTVRVENISDGLNLELHEKYRRAFGKSLSGIDVFYDEPDMTMGSHSESRASHPYADKLRIFTSKMLNDGSHETVDEHSAFLLERDPDWKILREATNLDAVSQITALALAEKIATSLRNYRNNDGPAERVDLKKIKDYCNIILEGFDENQLR